MLTQSGAGSWETLDVSLLIEVDVESIKPALHQDTEVFTPHVVCKEKRLIII